MDQRRSEPKHEHLGKTKDAAPIATGTDQQKSILDALTSFRLAAWTRFARRAELEWKFSFGIWTATAALTGILLTDKVVVKGTTLFRWAVPYAIVLFLLHAIWQHNLIKRNNGDRAEEDYYEEEIANRLGIERFPLRLKRVTGIWHYSPMSQLAITLLLNLFLLAVVWLRTHQP